MASASSRWSWLCGRWRRVAAIALAVLSIFWLWNGIAYHLLHFLQINFAALGFAALFALQGVLFAGYAVGGRSIFRFRTDAFGWSGLLLCLFALAAYPLLGWLAGHGWPRAGVFGVAPAPTTIFTFGMLLMLEGGAPLYLFAIPALWSLAGGSAAVFILRIPEDVSLLVAGISWVLYVDLEAPTAIATERSELRNTTHLKNTGGAACPSGPGPLFSPR